MGLETLFVILILILSVVIHEVSHGYAALMLGDQTAKLAGRLTLNPIKHLDPLGSVIIPGLLVLSNSPFMIGWAKPVPYNPYNLRNARWGEAIVAGAGPGVNIFIAAIFAIIIRLGVAYEFLTIEFVQIASFVVFINILLAIFNLLPIPPLDGSKVLKAILPYRLSYKYDQFTNWYLSFGLMGSLALLFVFFFFLIEPFTILLAFLFQIATGLPIGILFG